MKRILIVGGSGGIGQHLTNHFQQLPYEYEVHSHSSKSFDVLDYDGAAWDIERIAPDILIYLAAYNHDSMIHKLDIVKAERQIEVGITGLVNCVSAALPHMRSQGYGRIITASSVVTKMNLPGVGVYSGTKAFAENFMKSISTENAGKGITANALRLGYMQGGLMDKLPPKFKEKLLSEIIPARKFGHNHQIARTIDYLIEHDYTNGSVIEITGGL